MEFTDAITTARNAAELHDREVFIFDESAYGFGFQVYTYNVDDYDAAARYCPLAATVYTDSEVVTEPDYQR